MNVSGKQTKKKKKKKLTLKTKASSFFSSLVLPALFIAYFIALRISFLISFCVRHSFWGSVHTQKKKKHAVFYVKWVTDCCCFCCRWLVVGGGCIFGTRNFLLNLEVVRTSAYTKYTHGGTEGFYFYCHKLLTKKKHKRKTKNKNKTRKLSEHKVADLTNGKVSLPMYGLRGSDRQIFWSLNMQLHLLSPYWDHSHLEYGHSSSDKASIGVTQYAATSISKETTVNLSVLGS